MVDGEQRGNKWSRCLREKGAARWPLGADKEKEESKSGECVRDYTFLLLCHLLSIRTSRATRVWVSYFLLSRHHGRLEAHHSGLGWSPNPQAHRICFLTCCVFCDDADPFA